MVVYTNGKGMFLRADNDFDYNQIMLDYYCDDNFYFFDWNSGFFGSKSYDYKKEFCQDIMENLTVKQLIILSKKIRKELSSKGYCIPEYINQQNVYEEFMDYCDSKIDSDITIPKSKQEAFLEELLENIKEELLTLIYKINSSTIDIISDFLLPYLNKNINHFEYMGIAGPCQGDYVYVWTFNWNSLSNKSAFKDEFWNILYGSYIEISACDEYGTFIDNVDTIEGYIPDSGNIDDDLDQQIQNKYNVHHASIQYF